jgi:hypothetical protein
MKDIPRIITGVIIILIGLGLAIGALFIETSRIYLLIESVPALIIGIVILFNRKENEIEKVKFSK